MTTTTQPAAAPADPTVPTYRAGVETRITLVISSTVTLMETIGKQGRITTYKHRDLAGILASLPAGEPLTLCLTGRPNTAAKYQAACEAAGLVLTETIFDNTETLGSAGVQRRDARLIVVKRAPAVD